MTIMCLLLLLASLGIGIIGAWLLRRRRDLAAALCDDPGREAAADSLGVAPDDIEWNPASRAWSLTAAARERGVKAALTPPHVPPTLPPPEPRPLRIYVASSWACEDPSRVGCSLRAAGYEVYGCRGLGDRGNFLWDVLDAKWEAWTSEEFRKRLDHPKVIAGFERDMRSLEAADACVLALPSGRSAHLEAGWAVGNGIPLIIYAAKPEQPELMYRMAQAICAREDELLAAVGKIARRRRAGHWLFLAEVEGLRPAEISEQVGLPVATVELELQAARALVAQGIAEVAKNIED
jgi:uncharacterized protein YcgL (UPF0745 family)